MNNTFLVFDLIHRGFFPVLATRGVQLLVEVLVRHCSFPLDGVKVLHIEESGILLRLKWVEHLDNGFLSLRERGLDKVTLLVGDYHARDVHV